MEQEQQGCILSPSVTRFERDLELQRQNCSALHLQTEEILRKQKELSYLDEVNI